MLHQNAEIITSTGRPRSRCSVSAQTLLADVAKDHIDSPHPYLIVEDEYGSPLGVIGIDDIRQRLNSDSFAERRRWMSMPVEAALSGRFENASALTRRPHLRIDRGQKIGCTALSEHDQLLAVVTDDDVLVSWRSIEKLIRQSQNDHVTDLPTRAAFESHLKAECSRAYRNRDSVGVILVDVDYFKSINDQFGHPAGDAVLSAVGRALRNSLRSYDMVARFGGDEFAVLCCGCRPGEVEVTISRLRDGMRKLQTDVSLPRPIPTLSIGACVAHDLVEIKSSDQIVEAADECLYFAKREGRNRSFVTELGVESVVSC
jgi:diguanylate cyclase (GGDEF)-like protein